MKRSYLITLHLCYWLYSLDLLPVIEKVLFRYRFIRPVDLFSPLTFSYLFVGLCVFYTNYFFVLPSFFKTKRSGKLWLAWLILLAGGIALRYIIEEVLFVQWFGFGNYKAGTSLYYYVFDNLYFIGIYIVMSTVFWTVNYWIIAEREKGILQEQKFIAEATMLKNQVNAHFLFNTLNNIYSLSYRGSDSAPESILKLSALMRYMLKEGSADRVLLSQELEYINNFIDLQRLRYSRPEHINYTYNSDRDDYSIAPLLLIPFIENAFKHGSRGNEMQPLSVAVSALKNKLLLEVSNSKSAANKDESSGIGLNNVKRRLELLYPSMYTLNINETDDTYHCQLTINLKS